MSEPAFVLTVETASILRIPSEVMALCFGWLEFRDRMTASHVSRLWRSISLAHPAVWANIDVSASHGDVPMLLQMALSRTGTHSLSITGSVGPDPNNIVAQCLREHLHHVRRLDWDLPHDSLPLHASAPLMEELICYSYHIDVPVDFLGGQPARLRTLNLSTVSLPDTCLALSTVKSLALDGPVLQEHAETYAHLFDLFPDLTSLSLHNLREEYARLLPPGPAPPSLQTLFLATQDETYDLTPHLAAWRTKNMIQVDLIQVSALLPQLAQVVEGAEGLEVAVYKDIRIVAAAQSCISSISFMHRDSEDAASDIAQLILNTQDALRSLARLSIPLPMLTAFLPILSAFPKLAQLELAIVVSSAVPVAAHQFPWDLLSGILRVKEARPTVHQIILHAMCSYEGCPLTSDDMQQLVDRVLVLGDGGGLPWQICIKGFPLDATNLVRFDQPMDSSFEIWFLCQPFYFRPGPCSEVSPNCQFWDLSIATSGFT